MLSKKINSNSALFLAFLGACSSSTPPKVESPSLETQPVKVESSETERKDLSKEPIPAPAPVTSITISMDIVAEDLGVPKHRLEKQIQILANFIESRRLPNGVCPVHDDESSAKLCSQIESYRTDRKSMMSENEGRRVPIRPNYFDVQQGMGYGRLQKSIHKESPSRVLAWAPQLLAITSCPRNLSAVAIRKLESLLPSPKAQDMIERLYEHASACLQPDDEGFEPTHFRQALLRELWGNRQGALLAVRKAVQARDSQERPRVLYWAGRLESDPALRKKYWNRLITESPLSFHALEVWTQAGVDPYEIFSRRASLSLDRKVEGQWQEIGDAMRWLEALYILNRIDAAQRFARWITRTYRDQMTASNLLYISSLKSSRTSPLNEITFFTRQISENPVLLNEQTLKLLFPKPYFDVFDHASPNTDTFLVLGVARQESGFNPHARSPANAQGLLQVLPRTARVLSGHRRNNLYDTATNATLGVKFLSQLIERFDNSVELALGAYNAGPGRVYEWLNHYNTRDATLFLDLIPFKETRNYISSILRNNYWYERLYSGDPDVVAARAFNKSKQKSVIVSRLVSAHVNNRMPASVVQDPQAAETQNKF